MGGGRARPFGVLAGFVVSFTAFTLALSAIVQALGIPVDALRIVAVVLIISLRRGDARAVAPRAVRDAHLAARAPAGAGGPAAGTGAPRHEEERLLERRGGGPQPRADLDALRRTRSWRRSSASR